MKGWSILSGLIGTMMIMVCAAQAQSADPMRFVRWTIEDIASIPSSSLSLRSGLTIGIASGSILAVSHFDRRFSREAKKFADSTAPRVRRILHEVGNVNIIRPMAAIVFVGSLTSGDVYFQEASFTSLESIVFANLLTNTLKFVVGRARPHANLGPNSLKPFGGSRSFPSGHATTVFAFTTPWVVYYPGIISGALFVLGVGTAVVRMADEHHWFSDVLGGAFIGFGTGYLLSRRHQRLKGKPQLGLSTNRINLTWSI